MENLWEEPLPETVFTAVEQVDIHLWQQILALAALSVPLDDKDEIIFTLSRVCREWRVAVNNCPQIWATIPPIVTKDLESAARALSSLSYAKRYLERSGTLPLDFSLLIVDDVVILPNNGWENVFEVFLDHSERWRSVDVDTSLNILPALQRVKGRLHALEKLRIRASPPPFHHMEVQQALVEMRLDCFSEAPRLKHLDLGISSHSSKIDVSVPLHLLHSITFVSCTVNNLYENLCSSPHNLRQLIVKSDVLSQSYPTLPTVTFPQLEHLVYSGQFNARFLDSLTLPALTNLEFRANGGHISVRGLNTKIVALLTRSKCALQHLSLGRMAKPVPEELKEIFTLTPILTHLDVCSLTSSELKSPAPSFLNCSTWSLGSSPRTLVCCVKSSTARW